MGATNSNEVSFHRLKVSFSFGVDNVHHCISIPSYVNVILVNSKQRYPLSPALVPSAYNAWKSIFQGNKHRPSSTQWQFPCPPLHLHSRLFHFLPIFLKDPLHSPLSAPILFPFPIWPKPLHWPSLPPLLRLLRRSNWRQQTWRNTSNQGFPVASPRKQSSVLVAENAPLLESFFRKALAKLLSITVTPRYTENLSFYVCSFVVSLLIRISEWYIKIIISSVKVRVFEYYIG